MASVFNTIPPCDSEYPGYPRVLYLIQQGTQSSTPKTSQMGYLDFVHLPFYGRQGTVHPPFYDYKGLCASPLAALGQDALQRRSVRHSPALFLSPTHRRVVLAGASAVGRGA